ncbi:MAG: hypothetical protein IPG45_02400 [Deltaproteobacteria bacterium]|jgi:hypothetical protein|nr:hypothetical protein [Deltaproteobacteria bacterium]
MGSSAHLLLGCLLVATACGTDPPEPTPPGPSNLNLAIGTGAADGMPGFVPITDGQELMLEPGAQGGFHVFVNVRLDQEGVSAVGDFPIISREARRVATGQLVSKAQHKVRLTAGGANFDTEKSIPLFLCPTPIGIPVADEMLELKVEVRSTEDSAPITGTIRFLPRCPGGDQNTFCQRICFG